MNMQGISKRIVVAVGAVSAAALLMAGALMLPARIAWAQDAPSAPIPLTNVTRTITVVGEGEVKVAPDIARVNIGVDVMRPSVREASDANQVLIDSVLKAVQAVGVEKADIQTSGFSVSAERYGANGPLPEDEVNYRVSNNVTVTVRDLTKVSKVLDAAILAGANNIYGVEFALDDSRVAQSEARKTAVADAKARAEDLAMLTGVEVGEVVSVSEVIGNNAIYGAFRENVMALGSGNGTPIQPGQFNLTLQLQVVYAIAPASGQ